MSRLPDPDFARRLEASVAHLGGNKSRIEKDFDLTQGTIKRILKNEGRAHESTKLQLQRLLSLSPMSKRDCKKPEKPEKTENTDRDQFAGLALEVIRFIADAVERQQVRMNSQENGR